ncbi:hypothetical protein BCV69DRAFT_177984 [Microstroma glucosiphilum]|uniref:Uncharacterized protein n=1 Tax=Pseudomicrostroma glucosiphilum TaxID=1684307 RepID=A0A316UCW7_9BASI|nr:hypothetical protein BCV69DRAFT_177984 [Pseudomicrostroma glucosiphilum]PWN20885.1 hypothetical protein BCV69DRAFT_177984 [Pseudomicrostroma glucosiphilum]
MSTTAGVWAASAPPSYHATQSATLAVGSPPASSSFPSSSISPGSAASHAALAQLRDRVLPIYAEHTSLHDSITPLLALPSLLTKTEEELYVSKGLLTSKRTAWKRLDGRVHAAHQEYRSRKPALGRSLMLPGRKLKWEKEHIRNEEDSIASIKVGLERLALLDTDLDALDASLFAGPTPTHPSDDLLESVVLILTSTQRILKAEADRESRARGQLGKSRPCIEKVLGALKECLTISNEVGVTKDQKYTRQIFSNGGGQVLARRITPILQGAKTASGKGHTFFAEARGTQLLIRPMPTLKLVDLNLLSGRVSGAYGKQQLSERAIHASIETSYAQSLALLSHLKRELDRSRRRSKFFKGRLGELAEEEKRVKDLLRRRRRDIICVLSQSGVEAAVLDEERAQAQTSVYRAFGEIEGQDTGAANDHDNGSPTSNAGARGGANGEEEDRDDYFDDDEGTLAGDLEDDHAGAGTGQVEEEVEDELQGVEAEVVTYLSSSLGTAFSHRDRERDRNGNAALGATVSRGQAPAAAAPTSTPAAAIAATAFAVEDELTILPNSQLTAVGLGQAGGSGSGSGGGSSAPPPPPLSPHLGSSPTSPKSNPSTSCPTTGNSTHPLQLPATHPLSPHLITLKSTRALRRILRECVRECNANDPHTAASGEGRGVEVRGGGGVFCIIIIFSLFSLLFFPPSLYLARTALHCIGSHWIALDHFGSDHFGKCSCHSLVPWSK